MTNKSLSFTKSSRVLRSDHFGKIIRTGACVADGVLVLNGLLIDTDRPSRLGITIPKKVGSAVKRNRWKRLIREAFRTQPDRIPHGYDLVVRPKRGAEPDWDKIRNSLPGLIGRLARTKTHAGSRGQGKAQHGFQDRSQRDTPSKP